MPIAKRLTEAERLNRILPKGWRSAIQHPIIKKLIHGGFDPSPRSIVNAINTTKTWKGATWEQKVFVHALDIILEKAYGEGILDVDAYNRLQDHLTNNEHKMQASDWRVWHIWVWDVYHDHFKLHDMEPGELVLPSPKKRLPIKKKRPVKKRPKRKVAK